MLKDHIKKLNLINEGTGIKLIINNEREMAKQTK